MGARDAPAGAPAALPKATVLLMGRVAGLAECTSLAALAEDERSTLDALRRRVAQHSAPAVSEPSANFNAAQPQTR